MGTLDFIDHSCGFCVEINDLDAENNLLKNLITPQTGLKSRFIYENDKFVVMACLGSFVEGYVLIVSKIHYDCVGKMPIEDIREMDRLLSVRKKKIKQAYNTSVVCFEHGSVSCVNKFGGCLNHAHVHIVPCNVSLIQEISQYDLQVSKIPSLALLRDQGGADNPYLFFEDVDGEQYMITGEYIASQFFRKLIANHAGLSDSWDWRNNLFLDNVEKTVRRFMEDGIQE